MSTELKQTVTDYISKTRVSTLATVRDDGAPVIRAIGGFAPDGLNIYFSTAKTSSKTAQIGRNNVVSFYFQHDNQEIATFKYVSLVGKAAELASGSDRQRAIQILSARNPRFKAKADKGELQDTAIYKVAPQEVKYLDLTHGPTGAQYIKL